jgi:PAS domain S-box-containing protein
MKRTIILFIWFSISVSQIISVANTTEKGIPFITNYITQKYKAHNQNWDICVDNRGFFYFANGDGVLVYDGNNWELVNLPNKISSRALGKDPKGLIYTAGTNELGCLQPDPFGKLKYISFMDSLGIKEIGIIRDIQTINNNVYFRSLEYLIRLNDNGFKAWKAQSEFTIQFVFNNELFAIDEKVGLFKVVDDSMVLTSHGVEFANTAFYFAFQYEDEVILANRKHGLFRFKPGDNGKSRLIPIYGNANQFLIDEFVYCGNITPSGDLILGTNNGGCVIVDRNGNIKDKIDKSSGLQHNNVHSIYIDSDKNLWLALNNGISRCDISVPISYWNESVGVEGIIEAIIRFKGILYLATHQGIYLLENSQFKKLQNSISQAWAFLNFKLEKGKKEILLVATTQGVFRIDNQSLTKIADLSTVYRLYQSKTNPNLVFIGMNNNLGIVEITNTKSKYLGAIPHSGVSIRSIAEDDNGDIWLGTYRDGVVRIIPSDDLLNPKQIIQYKIESGLPSLKNVLIYYLEGNMIFATEFGIYTFDYNTNSFVEDIRFKNMFTGNLKDVFSIVEDPTGSFYFTQLVNKRGSIGFAEKSSDGSYTLNNKIFNKIPEMMVRSIYLDYDRSVWIGGTDGLFRIEFDKNTEFDKKYNAYIRKVTIKNDSCIFYGNNYTIENDRKYLIDNQNTSFIPKIDFRHNTLKFNFTASEFSNEAEFMYQYKLDGFDEKWSEWTKSSSKEYTNLWEGNYTFRVRASNIYDITSKEASYSFTILPPWYRSILAFVVYLVISTLFIFIVVRISMRKLRSVNTELERLVQKRTSEINFQKEEILTQSQELEFQNKELEKLSIIARETDNAIVIADPNGNIEWINEGFTRLYGYTLQELRKKNFITLADFSLSTNIKEKIEYCLQTKESSNYESLNHSKSGQNIWSQTTITPILNDNGDVVKLIAIDSDISKLKLAEMEVMQQKDEIQQQRDFAQQQKQFIEQQNIELEKHRTRLEQLVRERTADLEIAKERAEQSDRLKSAFLANMSHEIRTPMNAIIGFSNILNETELSVPEREELLQHIVNNSNTLLHLIDDIIDIAKIEAGQLTIDKKNCAINKVLTEVLETFNEGKKSQFKKDIELRFNPGVENPSFYIYTDPLRLQQVITNLLDNALKFTDKGFIEFGYTLEDTNEIPIIRFYVRDTGIGLTLDQQKQIFSRFTKVENDKKKLYRGAGLGLAICKNIIGLLDGEIFVESEFNKGSVFSFTIPYIKITERDNLIKENQKTGPDYKWPGKTILIAEDEESNYRFLEMLLSKSEVRVLHAENGKQVLEMYQKNEVDLILMDIKMPEMDGLDATRAIKKVDKEIPIIAQTAFAMENDEKMSLDAGCDAYISKPIRKHKLFELLNEYLGQP